jgi:hypothetical protein
MAAIWKRMGVAGTLSAVTAYAVVRAGVHWEPFGLETPAAAFFVVCPAFFAVLSLPPLRRGLLRLWPDFPAALDPELEREGKIDADPYAKGQSFVGRGATMNGLVAAARQGAPGFRWRQVHGGPGLGKTRLGLEWLKALRARGWDVGVLRPDATAQQLRDTIFRRRRLAILIDDADRDGALWEKLDALARHAWKHPAQALLTASGPLSPPESLDEEIRNRLSATQESGENGAVLATRLTRQDVAVWADAADFRPPGRRKRKAELPPDRLAATSGGRPYFLRLLGKTPGADNPWRLVAEIADNRLAAATKALGPDGAKLLALAALAGPFPIAETARILDRAKPPGRGKLARFLPELAYAPPGLLPPPQSSWTALEIAVRVLSGCNVWERERLIEQARALNPAATTARLVTLAAERPEVLEMFRRDASAVFADDPANGALPPPPSE